MLALSLVSLLRYPQPLSRSLLVPPFKGFFWCFIEEDTAVVNVFFFFSMASPSAILRSSMLFIETKTLCFLF